MKGYYMPQIEQDSAHPYHLEPRLRICDILDDIDDAMDKVAESILSKLTDIELAFLVAALNEYQVDEENGEVVSVYILPSCEVKEDLLLRLQPMVNWELVHREAKLIGETRVEDYEGWDDDKNKKIGHSSFEEFAEWCVKTRKERKRKERCAA